MKRSLPEMVGEVLSDDNGQISSWLVLHSGSDVKAMNKFVVRDYVLEIHKNRHHEVMLQYEAQNDIYATFLGDYCECCKKRVC